jgi:hypothetical protein
MKSAVPAFDLSIIPHVNSVSRFSLLPGRAVFASIDVGPGNYHLYDVGKFKEKNNVLQLEISQCTGKIQFHFSNQVNYLDTDAVHTIQNVEYKNGKFVNW